MLYALFALARSDLVGVALVQVCSEVQCVGLYGTVSQAYFALHETLHKVQKF
jgi:hypothetical protein